MFHLIIHCKPAGNASPFSLVYEVDKYINAACHVAVNCFALISGYVWFNARWSISKIVRCWSIGFFYSVVLNGIVFLLDGKIYTLKEDLLCLFPVFSGYQWYLTAYVFLFFCIPVLKVIVNSLSKKQLELFLTIILLLTTVLPMLLRIDSFHLNFGYSPYWLCILFLVGNYVAKYDPYKNISSRKWLFSYLVFTTLTWGVGFLVEYVTNIAFGSVSWGDWLYNYSSFSVFIASFSLFMFFKQNLFSVRRTKILKKISGATFGIYLIHTTKGIWKMSGDYLVPFSNDSIFGYCLTLTLFTIGIFLVAAVIEILRESLFRKARINQLISRIDSVRPIRIINETFNHEKLRRLN